MAFSTGIFFSKRNTTFANAQVEKHRCNVNKTVLSHPYQTAISRFGHWAFHSRPHLLWSCSEGWFGRGALIWRDMLISIWAWVTSPRQQLFRVQLACYSYGKKKQKKNNLRLWSKGGKESCVVQKVWEEHVFIWTCRVTGSMLTLCVSHFVKLKQRRYGLDALLSITKCSTFLLRRWISFFHFFVALKCLAKWSDVVAFLCG